MRERFSRGQAESLVTQRWHQHGDRAAVQIAHVRRGKAPEKANVFEPMRLLAQDGTVITVADDDQIRLAVVREDADQVLNTFQFLQPANEKEITTPAVWLFLFLRLHWQRQ